MNDHQSQGEKQTNGFFSLLKRFFAPVMFLFLLVSKFGKFLLFIFKFGKFGSLLTMLVSVWAYSLAFGWPFAFGFVLLIFIHELGHALMLKHEGIDAGLPVFIPFMGAFIAMKGMPRNAWIEAKVGIGGPFLGSLGALAVLLVGIEIDSTFCIALAQTGFLINLFNMIPVSPMDGGRIAGGVSQWFLWVGMVIGCYIFYLIRSPILLIILILGALHLWQSFKNPVPGYYDIPASNRLTMGSAYLCLLASLIYGLRFTKPYLAHISHEKVALLWILPALVGSVLDSFSPAKDDQCKIGELSTCSLASSGR